MRITNPAGASFVYSGDTGYCDAVIDLARGADVFLCEASWTHAPDRPPNLHLSGTEAGRIATAGRGGGVVADPHPAVDLARGRDQRGQSRIRRPGARGGVRRDIQRRALLSG